MRHFNVHDSGGFLCHTFSLFLFQVQEYFKSIEKGLAECVFAVAAQSGLEAADTSKLIEYLSKVNLESANADGSLDETDTALVMALLYAIDVPRQSQQVREMSHMISSAS